MTGLKNYKTDDFSVTLSTRMNGIEIVFNDKMDDKTLAEIKDAGFRWSKRQQKWWAYHTEKSARYAASLVESHEEKKNSLETTSPEKIEDNANETAMNELAELVRQRTEIERRIAAIKDAVNESEKTNDISSQQVKNAASTMTAPETNAEKNSECSFTFQDKEYLERVSRVTGVSMEVLEAGIQDAENDALAFYDGSRAQEEGRSFKEYAASQLAVGFIEEEFSLEREDADAGIEVDTLALKVATGEIATYEQLEAEAERTRRGLREEKPAEEQEVISERPQEIKDLFASERHTQGQVRRIREEVKKILAENTDEQIAGNSEMLSLLAQYEGGGGISGEDNRTPAEVLNAFYTPREVVNAVWRLADHYAPNAKTVLEPSCGIGRFAENHDGDKEFTLHELDETSARIARILHPKANVIQGAFQKQFFDEDGRVVNKDYEPPKYDIVIGNPPYGENKSIWAGRGEGKQFARLEEYFLSRGLDSLKDENSALLFVMPSTFLKSFPDNAKRLVAEKCVLVDAYRLPNGTFDTTDVGTDIIVLKKGSCRAEEISGDNFFKNHPEKILGEEYLGTDRFGKEVTKIRPRGANSLQGELNKIAQQLEKTEERKTEFAAKIADRYISIHETGGGYDYSIIGEDYKTIDGGVIENSSSDIKDIVEGIIEDLKNDSHSANARGGILNGDRWTAADYDELTKAMEKADTRLSFNEETSVRIKHNLEWLVNVRGCDKEKAQAVLERLYAAESKFKTHREAFERSKAIPLAFGDEHKGAEWVDGKELEETIGIFDENLDYHTIWDRSWAAKQGMKKDDIARLLEWDYSVGNRFIEKESGSLFPEMQKKVPNHIFVDDFERKEHDDKSVSSEKGRDAETNLPEKKSETLTSQEFARLYGKEFSEGEFKIWRATDWEGVIDRSKLSIDDEERLHSSENYVEVEPGKFTHKVLFESGDIAEKIQHYKNKIKRAERDAKDAANENDADASEKDISEITKNELGLYRRNLAALEKALPPKIPIERLHFGVNSTLAEEFMVEHVNDDGKTEKLSLQESFILWATGNTLQSAYSEDSSYFRGEIDFTTANISEEELPPNISWFDIVEYIDKKAVIAEKTRSGKKDEDEIKAEKAQKRKEADEKRMARSETADKLFDKYLHEGLSEELGRQVEAEYNRRFNSYVIPDYSKLPLFIDGMSREKNGKKFKLYKQQVKGVSFLTNKGNGILAYDVGVGKTAAGIVASIGQTQTGRSKRPLIVVPNAVYSTWYKDIAELFPNVKINDLYNLSNESTGKYRDRENPHKLIIPEKSITLVTYEALKNITFTDHSCENELKEDFSKLLSEDFEGNDRENAQGADKIKNVIGSASQVKDVDFFFYEDCGWDNITVDEAHNFKNLWTVPRPKNKGESNEFAGIPSGEPSARALKLYGMTQLTQRHNEDRNVFLLTATPFTNSPLEVYSMLSYVGRKRLIKSGLYSLRDFCNQFAHTKLELGVNSKGEIDQKQVMKNWKELPALQKLLTEFIDKVDGEELKEIIRPKKFTHVQELEMSDLQKKMMEQDIESMGEVKEGNSAAIITSMNAMRLALVAPALSDPARYKGLALPSKSELVATSPKLKFVCDSVVEMYKDNPEKGQFIYMPLGKEAHGIVKDYLVARGLPKESIEIINGEINSSTQKKYKVTRRFNDPKDRCKILIGGKNTSEGINLNGNSFAMYNCSLGWNPSETVQVEGRIWRQGNAQGHVHCCYPVMNDSIDSVLYQKHDEKRSRINELWTYKESDSLNVEDINPEDLKFDLLKDPKKRARLILENGIEEKDNDGNITFRFEGTKVLQNELDNVNGRLKSFDEVYEKRTELKENLRETEFAIRRDEKNIRDYKERGLKIPEWLKSELKDSRKHRSSYERQLETISRKFASWGIKTEEDFEKFIPIMNEKKRSLERQLANKMGELPKLLERETVRMNEAKTLLPSLEQQIKDFTKDVQENLRPMSVVEPEIKTERFEEMLSKKWEKGEITTKEREKYSSWGYDNYEKWLAGEIEDIGNPAPKISVKVKVEQNVDETEKKITENTKEEKKTVDVGFNTKAKDFTQNFLFDIDELQRLSMANKAIEQKSVHQLIAYTSDNGANEKHEYKTLSEAQKYGHEWFKKWNLDEKEDGFVIFNKESKKIEHKYGHFPFEQIFSNEVLKANGFQARDNTAEAKIGDVAQAIKDKVAGQAGNVEKTMDSARQSFETRKQKTLAGVER